MKNIILFKNLWLERLTDDINNYINKNNVELIEISSIFRDGGYYDIFVTINTDKKINNTLVINGVVEGEKSDR